MWEHFKAYIVNKPVVSSLAWLLCWIRAVLERLIKFSLAVNLLFLCSFKGHLDTMALKTELTESHLPSAKELYRLNSCLLFLDQIFKSRPLPKIRIFSRMTTLYLSIKPTSETDFPHTHAQIKTCLSYLLYSGF